MAIRHPDLSRAIWRKSGRSSPTSNNCVEVARNLPAVVAVRDSKDPDGGVLRFGPGGWKTFLEGIRTGSGC
jgi:Domain of unknown function (DUF397)